LRWFPLLVNSQLHVLHGYGLLMSILYVNAQATVCRGYNNSEESYEEPKMLCINKTKIGKKIISDTLPSSSTNAS